MTQKQLILRYMQEGREISPLDALREFGCFRLGARIHELRRDGWDVVSRLHSYKNHYGQAKTFALYHLAGTEV
jgi:hypothetical protein